MNGDELAQIAWFGMAFTLVISAVIARRIPAGTMLKMVAAWTLIFGAVFLIVVGWQSVG